MHTISRIIASLLLLLVTAGLWAQDTTQVSASDFQISEVQVSASRKTTVRNRYSPYDSQRIDSKELCKAACCNLSEAFETNASVDVSYSDAATGAKTIRLLGLQGTYVQLLGENCPAVRGLAQNFGLSYVPGPWMESIQVSKGTSSVINGYEAIAGQINVEYLKPQTQSPIAVNAMLNTNLRAEVNAMGGWTVNRTPDQYGGQMHTGVLAHYEDESFAMDENRDGFLDMPKVRNLNLLNRWYYKNDMYTFQLLVNGLHDSRRGGQRETAHDRRHQIRMPENPYEISLTTDRLSGFMKNGIVFDPETGMSLGIITSASYHHQRNDYGMATDLGRRWNASQWNAYANIIFQNSWCDETADTDMDHKLSAGFSFNYDQYDETLALHLPEVYGSHLMTTDLSRREATPGIFAEYTFKLEDTFSFIAGLRGDYSTRYGFFCTPRLNARYAPFEWWTLRGSVGLGYRSPNLVADYAAYLPSSRSLIAERPDREGNIFPNLAPVAGQQGIKQEQSLNVGFTTTFDIPMGKRTMQLSLEYYYTHFMNALVADVDASAAGVSFYNLSDVDGRYRSHNAQIEASMEILRGWTMTAAFRYTDVRQTTYDAVAGCYRLRERALQGRYKGVITSSYVTPLRKWQFDVTAQFNGPSRLPDGFYYSRGAGMVHEDGRQGAMSPWYPQLMAQITKYWRTCSLYVGAENMTNYRQDRPVYGADIVEKQAVLCDNFDASMIFAPTDGWKIYVGFRYALDRPEED